MALNKVPQQYLQLNKNNSPDKNSHIVYQSQNQFRQSSNEVHKQKKQNPYEINKLLHNNINLKTIPKQGQVRQTSRDSNRSNKSNLSRVSQGIDQQKYVT